MQRKGNVCIQVIVSLRTKHTFIIVLVYFQYTAQTIMVWSKEESKRQKSDLVDVDVVLNMVTEELESQM